MRFTWGVAAAGRARGWLLMAAASSVLAACATPQPRFDIDVGGGPASAGDLGSGPPAQPVPGTMRPYQVAGVWYRPRVDPNYDETGIASWYGPQFHQRQTSDGEIFDMDMISAAHKTLPLPCIVEVTNLENGRKLRLRVNDRGPFVAGRIIDLSRGAAKVLGVYQQGTARVRVRYIGPAPKNPPRAAPPARPQAAPPGLSSAGPSRPVDAGPMTSGAPFRIQAGAFSSQAAAQRAADHLAGMGDVRIEALERNGATLWRVTVSPSDGASDSMGLRARVAGAGFPDARVLPAN